MAEIVFFSVILLLLLGLYGRLVVLSAKPLWFEPSWFVSGAIAVAVLTFPPLGWFLVEYTFLKNRYPQRSRLVNDLYGLGAVFVYMILYAPLMHAYARSGAPGKSLSFVVLLYLPSAVVVTRLLTAGLRKKQSISGSV